jgi:hypothetical protein
VLCGIRESRKFILIGLCEFATAVARDEPGPDPFHTAIQGSIKLFLKSEPSENSLSSVKVGSSESVRFRAIDAHSLT